MNRPLTFLTILAAISGASVACPVAATANNTDIESVLAGYSDTSVFYTSLLNTGVANELDPNIRYTVFAPTNDAFAAIRPDLYPCFYSTQCRSQVADILRDHISIGGKTLRELVRIGDVKTLGRYQVHAESPYVGDYSVAHNKILSGSEVRGNMIYRIDGIIVSNQQLALFQVAPQAPSTVTQQKTIITYHTPTAHPIPGGSYSIDATQTVTEKNYFNPGTPVSTTVIYPDGSETKTTERTDMYPNYSSGRNETTTTVTRDVSASP